MSIKQELEKQAALFTARNMRFGLKEVAEFRAWAGVIAADLSALGFSDADQGIIAKACAELGRRERDFPTAADVIAEARVQRKRAREQAEMLALPPPKPTDEERARLREQAAKVVAMIRPRQAASGPERREARLSASAGSSGRVTAQNAPQAAQNGGGE